MRRTALLCTLWMALFTPALAEERQVVAVFELEAKGLKLDAQTRDRLTDYLSSLLAAEPRFQVLPRAQVKDRLRDAKSDSYRACYDESCQIEIGRELAAQKTLNAQVLKLADQCKVSLTLYDLKRASSDGAATESGGCTESDLVTSLERAMAALLGKPASAGNAPKVDLKLQALQLGAVPKEMRVDGSAVPTDIEPDLLVLYEDALARDKDGPKKPQEALAAWKAVATFKKGKNPFKTDALKRVKEWDKYFASRAKLEKQHAQDRDKLEKLLGLKLMKIEQKTALFRGFIERYALAFGLPELEALAAKASPEEATALRAALLTRELFDGLCQAEDKRACEELARVDREAEAAKAAAEAEAKLEAEQNKLQADLHRLLEEGWVVVDGVTAENGSPICTTGVREVTAGYKPPFVIPYEPSQPLDGFSQLRPAARCLEGFFLVHRPDGYAAGELLVSPTTFNEYGNAARVWAVPPAKGRQCAVRKWERVHADFKVESADTGSLDYDEYDSAASTIKSRLESLAKERCECVLDRASSFCSKVGLEIRSQASNPRVHEWKSSPTSPEDTDDPLGCDKTCVGTWGTDCSWSCFANLHYRCALGVEALDMNDCQPVNP